MQYVVVNGVSSKPLCVISGGLSWASSFPIYIKRINGIAELTLSPESQLNWLCKKYADNSLLLGKCLTINFCFRMFKDMENRLTITI